MDRWSSDIPGIKWIASIFAAKTSTHSENVKNA
jgi:hypothetical protein